MRKLGWITLGVAAVAWAVWVSLSADPPRRRAPPPAVEPRPAIVESPAAPVAEPRGDDWPMLQGNAQRTGRSAAPAIVNPIILWRATIGAMDRYNAPIVVGNRVWVTAMGGDREGMLRGVVCLNRATGRTLWTHQTVIDPRGAAWGKGAVIVTFDAEYAVAMDAASGMERWRRSLAPSGEIGPEPLVIDNTVFVSTVSHVHVLDAATGASMREPIAVTGVAPPELCADDEFVYVATRQGIALRLAIPVEGHRPLPYNVDAGRHFQLPAIAGGRTLVLPACEPGRVGLPPLTVYEIADQRFGWTGVDDRAQAPDRDERRDAIAHPIAIVDRWALSVDATAGELIATDLDLGEEVRQYPLRWPIPLHESGVVVAGETAYVGTTAGFVTAIDVQTGDRPWRIDLYGDERARRLTLADAQAAAESQANEPKTRTVRTPMAIAADGMLLVATVEGYLYAICDRDRVPPQITLEPVTPVADDAPDAPWRGWPVVRVGDVLKAGSQVHTARGSSALVDVIDPPNLPEPLRRFSASSVGVVHDLPGVCRVLSVEGEVRGSGKR